MNWAMEDPARFLQERATLNTLEREVDWLTAVWRIGADGSIGVDIDMVIHGRNYAGRMTYPDVFPNSPPYIRPRDPSEKWTLHQYGAGGSLCLQWRADNWQPAVTGADIVRSAFELLSSEQHPENPGSVPSDHRLTEGQLMWSARRRFVGTVDVIRVWINLTSQSRAALKTVTVFNTRTTVTFVSEVADANEVLQEITDLPAGISDSGSLFSVFGEGWIFRSDAFVAGIAIDSIEELLVALTNAGFAVNDVLVQDAAGRFQSRLIVLLGADLISLRVFMIDAGEQPGFSTYRIIWPTSADCRLPTESEELAKVRVGIVGLGSIGSKVAISLARSGVRRFLLVDDDYLKPGNLVRHELYWGYVGVHKVDAVRDALTLVAAGVKVDARRHRVAGQESPVEAATILKDLADCDVLVDATANPEVFLRLAAIAKSNKKSLCWGELYATGYGGMIARARPDLDPNPLAVRDAYYAYLAQLPPAPYQDATGYDVENEQPLLAHDSDVGVISSWLTRLILDACLQRSPSEFPHPAYLIGMRAEWMFKEPFDTRPIDAQGGGWEETGPRAKDEEKQEAVVALLKMHAEAERADTDSAS